MTEHEVKRGGAERSDQRIVALTGVAGALGSALLRELEADRRYYKVVAIDLRKPSFPLIKTRFHKIDLTLPDSDAQIAAVLRGESVDTLVHLAFLGNFTHRAAWAHELESIGTMHVLNACYESPVTRYVHWGHSICYGARADNSAYLREDHPLARNHDAEGTFFLDKIDAEEQVRRFAQERPGVAVTVLRVAPLVYPGGENFISRLLQGRTVPVLMGYDPLVQLVHLDDAVQAFKRVTDETHPGVYNIASDGVLPLRTIVGLLGQVPVPVPWILARRVAGFLWMGQVVDVPPSFLNFLRYPCVMDTTRARTALQLVPRYNIHEILAEFIGSPARERVTDRAAAPR